jgi:signal transduction histidine kinase
VAEALTNVAKHAQAQRVELRARGDDRTLEITVTDDGVGGAGESERGSGLSGMRDRVAALGGSVSVQSPPGGGSRVRVVLPCA